MTTPDIATHWGIKHGGADRAIAKIRGRSGVYILFVKYYGPIGVKCVLKHSENILMY